MEFFQRHVTFVTAVSISQAPRNGSVQAHETHLGVLAAKRMQTPNWVKSIVSQRCLSCKEVS